MTNYQKLQAKMRFLQAISDIENPPQQASLQSFGYNFPPVITVAPCQPSPLSVSSQSEVWSNMSSPLQQNADMPASASLQSEKATSPASESGTDEDIYDLGLNIRSYVNNFKL